METTLLEANRSLSGVFSPVLTPFEQDGTVSAARFIKHCRWLIAQGVGLSVFGTNSEANSLSVQEKERLLAGLLEAGIPGDRLMPGTGLCNIPESVALTAYAVQAGCAGVLMLPPFYYKDVSDEGLFRYFASVIDAVADLRLRVYLYHIPPVSRVPLSPTLIERLLNRFGPIIAGIKDSSGDWNNTEILLRNFQSPAFSVFAGSETFLLANMRGGGAGCITATGNVNPNAINRLYRTWSDDAAAADAQQSALNKTRAIFAAAPIIPAMKFTLAHYSGDSTWAVVRPPLTELDESQGAKLLQALQQDGFTVPNASELAL